MRNVDEAFERSKDDQVQRTTEHQHCRLSRDRSSGDGSKLVEVQVVSKKIVVGDEWRYLQPLNQCVTDKSEGASI